jgi:hypothetical protein
MTILGEREGAGFFAIELMRCGYPPINHKAEVRSKAQAKEMDAALQGAEENEELS